LLGIYGFTFTGWTGAVYQILNPRRGRRRALPAAGRALLRYATSQIGAYGGLAAKLPRTASFFVIATLAMIGLPMLNGFVGEFLILSSTFTGSAKAGRLPRRWA
jgi:NADH-quinone oxidoreductase subunit M